MNTFRPSGPVRLALLSSVLLAAGCATSPSPESFTHYGPAQSLGDGTVQSFVTMTGDTPTALGVRVSESVLATLPADPGPAHGAHETRLALPSGIAVAPYDHISFDWQPQGHEPDGIYTRPHFDIHFYVMTAAERQAITPVDMRFDEKAARAPAPQYIPAGYVPTPGAVPQMGAHWIDPSSPEFSPDGFSRTFLYGFWDGRMSFLEPMLTKDFVAGVKTMPGQRASFPIPQAAAVETAGHYPTVYGVRYDADAQAYDILLEGLVTHDAVELALN